MTNISHNEIIPLMQNKAIVIYVCLLAIFQNCYGTTAIGSLSSLKVEPVVIDIGEHIPNEKVVVESTISNHGSKPVNIKEVKSSCGCMVVNPASYVIGSHESVKLKIDIHGPNGEGVFNWAVWVTTDEPNVFFHEIKITGKFIAKEHLLHAFPDAFDAGTIASGSVISRVIEIERDGEVPVGSLKMSASAEWVNIDTQEKGDNVLRLLVTAHIPKNIEEIKEEIIIQGKDGSDLLRIPIVGKVVSSIEVSPKMVLVSSQEGEYRFSVNNYDGTIPRLIEYKFHGNGLEMQSCSAYKNQTNHLIVKIQRQKSQKGFASGKLLLKYEEQEKPIEIMFVSP